jgi:protein-disulfide isomerase
MSTLAPPLSKRDPLRGKLTAPLQLVEFGDFECPFCGQAFPAVLALERALGDRLCVGFRHFPLMAHPHALQAAEAAESAAVQGRFWEMHDLLYSNQEALELPDLVAYAEAIGVEPGPLVDDLRTHRRAARIREHLRSGALSGVDGTPTFFINGVRHDGGHDFESLYEALTGAGAGREL